ncbi:hypothetical protein PV325_007026 [Microctonus aethiopoides]|nr:hypothetical protein PV325_007026 [Microctonus aethiopoides]
MLRNSSSQCVNKFNQLSCKNNYAIKKNGLNNRTLTYKKNRETKESIYSTTINNQTWNIHKVNNNAVYKSNKFSTLVPEQSQIVIAGAGIVANSVAYHLVLNGWRDILILEQNSIGSGTSRYGSGLLGLFKPIVHKNVISYSIKLYRQLQDMGYNIGMKQCGSINLAQTKDRVVAIKRRMAYNVPTGLHCEMLSKHELSNLYPHLNTDDIEGAVWVPEDAIVNPSAVCDVLAQLAQNGGAKYIENCQIDEVQTLNGRVKSVSTNLGTVSCEYFINCAGMWARQLGLKCNPPVRIPSYPAQRFYAIIKSLPINVTENLPIVRDYDSSCYMREWDGGLMAGWYENDAKLAFENANVPSGDWMKNLTTDNSHWNLLWNKIIKRIPHLQKDSDMTVYNCPDNFTPDGRWILGESPEVKNYFVAVGMNGNSLQAAGGIGKQVAEWLINGESTQELLPFNVQRFLDLHNNRQYLQQRIKEVVGRNYAILYPHQCEYKYARRLRCSPLYSVLEERGAIFGIKMAYERPLYFDSTYRRGERKPEMPAGSFYKPKFFDFMKEEYQACKEGVGIIDMSSFCKIEIKSNKKEVTDYLQQLCSNDADIPIGTITRTGMQNERGGYENDCMLVRQCDNSYFMVSPTSQQTRIYQWMSKHLPIDHSVWLNDVTSNYTVINVVGPKSTALLSELSNSDINMSPFIYKLMNIGYASDVMVMSFTHTGEPGYCLYIPSEYALHVYSRLIKVGKDYGVRDVGVLTQRFMRIERFIPFWAEELTPFVTPYEAGCNYTVNLDKKNFIGKSALQIQKDNGINKRLVLFVLDDLDLNQDVWAWGGEPVYRNGDYVGTITSAGYGFALDKLVGLGFISRPNDDIKTVTVDYIMDPSACYEIDIAGKRFPLRPNIHAIPIPVVNNKKYIPRAVNSS